MTRPTVELGGKVAAVTGGARGIGRATAQHLADRGMRVAIGDLDEGLAAETAAAVGSGARGYRLDVTDVESFAAFLEAVEADLGPIYGLINNAGIMLTGLFTEEADERTKAMIDVNAVGVATGCRLVLPGMLARGTGHIINSSSTAGRTGYPGIATYSATKFFVYGLSEALRAEVRGTGVEVSCLLPGFVDTDLTAGVRDTRLLRRVSPEDVATQVGLALERPRFEVWAPRAVGTMTALMGLAPRRLREAAIRAVGADRILLGADPAARSAYLRRVEPPQRPRNPE